MIDEQTSTPGATSAQLRAQADAQDAHEAAAAKQAALDAMTPEEKSAHDKAMQDEADAKQLVENPTDEQKKSTIGLETGDGKYAYIPLPDETDYRSVHVVYSGHSYKHVATDKDGRWLYRQE